LFTLEQTHLEFVLFLAILLHKAPTAFGLVSFLLQRGLSKRKILQHLSKYCVDIGVFAVATPLSAVFTYLIVNGIGFQNVSGNTGILLLFSGGTFLYVATMHILPEVFDKSIEPPSRSKMLWLVFGMFLPLLLSMEV
jgi:solute carrier family 39 (zinc transporter), member 9